MRSEPGQIDDIEAAIRKRRTTLADGRFLIYYTFEGSPVSTEREPDARHSEPDVRVESSEERNV